MKWPAASLPLILICNWANAAEVELSVENFTVSGTIVSAVLKITNNTSSPIRDAAVSCGFLSKDKKAIDVGLTSVRNIPVHSYAYETASIVTNDTVAFADCRITNIDYDN